MLKALAYFRYIDGTFKVVKKPFYQLLTINAFVTCDGAKKQLPFVFVLMSGKSQDDYVAVCTYNAEKS